MFKSLSILKNIEWNEINFLALHKQKNIALFKKKGKYINKSPNIKQLGSS